MMRITTMPMHISSTLFAGVAALGLFASAAAFAQEITGTLGSPGATTTIDGRQLPPPDPAFGGVIKEKASESTPWWPPRIVPPKGRRTCC
jgi:arylsulfatase